MRPSLRHQRSLNVLLASSALAFAACGGGGSPLGSQTADVVVTTSVIPPDGQCVHIVATRTGDFQTVEYQGALAFAKLKAYPGENRVTATAYPTPCASEPTNAPWMTDAQLTTFVTGNNTLSLVFHRNVDVGVDAQFDVDPVPLVVRAGSFVRTGRNGEDTTGPNFALDGWEVKQIPLPPATGPETLVFTTEGKGLPYTPRGMARTPDGTFVFQMSEPTAPLYALSATGAPVGTWPVTYPAGKIQWSNTDGLDAIDANHLVRTGWLNVGINCDATGNNCQYSGIEVLEKKTATDGSISFEVTQQILFSALGTEPLNEEYPVGVTAVPGGRFAVTFLPDVGSLLVLVNANGTIAAGPTAISGDVEGLFDDGAGRIVALDFSGHLTTYNDTDLKVRAGETASFVLGVDLNVPRAITWRGAGGGRYVTLASNRLVYATPGFDSITDVGLDATAYQNATGLDYRADTDEILLMDNLPPIDPVTGKRIPVVRFYNATTHALAHSVTLQTGATGQLRNGRIAWIPSTQQIVAHFHRPGALGADPTIDGVAFVLNASDGSLASSIDLRRYGFTRIASVRYIAATDELVFVASGDDAARTKRLVVTDRAGKPRRAYRVDALPYLSDLAPVTDGAFAGDFGAISAEPSAFARIALP
jgi:hypothetical protein